MALRKSHIALLVGAALLFIGPALTFISVSSSAGKGSFSGYDLEQGSNYVMCGIVLLIVLGVTMASKSPGLTKGMAILAIVAAVALGVFAAIIDIKDASASLEGGIEASAGIGAWVVLLGGLAGVVGGALLFKDEGVATPPPATPPPAV